MNHLVYYIELNLCCLLILAALSAHLRQRDGLASSSQRLLRLLMVSAMLVCLSDLAAGVLRGQLFSGARELIELSNLLYFFSISLCSFLWALFVATRTEQSFDGTRMAIFCLPILAILLLCLVNPTTEFFFRINEQNLYVRGPGVSLHWVVNWGYLLFATLLSLRAVHRTQTQQERDQLYPLLFFIVAPVLAAIVQMCFYGVSSTQVGITLSLLMIVLRGQSNQIMRDELTGINNRKALRYFIEGRISSQRPARYFVLLMDINHFKSINDTHGHLMGDQALIDTAAAMRDVCTKQEEHLILCRYGGDEFVIVGRKRDTASVQALCARLRSVVADTAVENRRPYKLEISIGYADGLCTGWSDITELLERADEAMYADKRQLKAASTT